MTFTDAEKRRWASETATFALDFGMAEMLYDAIARGLAKLNPPKDGA